MVLLGAWKVGGIYRTFVCLAAVGIVITAAYHLWLIHRAFLGEENPECKKYPDISAREVFTLAPLALIVLWIGVYPAPMLNVLNVTLERLTLLVIEGGRLVQ
jgi:NADH-quinone oxidoreductase subunit M